MDKMTSDDPINDVKLLKRRGESGRGQQVWIAWMYSTARERAYALDELKRLSYQKQVGTAMARETDHPTAKAAAASITRTEMTHLENLVHAAILRAGRKGLTWDEAEKRLGLRPGSISPRWKSLRKQKRILAALEK